MEPACERIVTEVFPSLRSLIAKELVENLNYKQTEAAKLMGITQPAISQYLKNSRGKNLLPLQENAEIMLAIKTAAKALAHQNGSPDPNILCGICSIVRKYDLDTLLGSKNAKPTYYSGGVAHGQEIKQGQVVQ